jgi:hypothetical protein
MCFFPQVYEMAKERTAAHPVGERRKWMERAVRISWIGGGESKMGAHFAPRRADVANTGLPLAIPPGTVRRPLARREAAAAPNRCFRRTDMHQGMTW